MIILLLDIHKAFDSVSHEFLFKVLNHFNFGENFIRWVKTFYSSRKSYVMNNGFLTKQIDMEKGIFQGCPISRTFSSVLWRHSQLQLEIIPILRIFLIL